MRRLLLVLVFLLSGCSVVPECPVPERPLQTIQTVEQAETRLYGLDTLAGAKYPRVIRTIPNTFAVGLFAETFGDAFPVVQNELAAGRVRMRVHFIWSDAHSFGDLDIPTIRRLAQKYAPLCAKYLGRLELSPFCEHNVQNPDKYLDIINTLAPGCTPVNTPWRGAFSKTYKNEIHGIDHGKPPGKYNHSYDGTNSVDSNVEAIKRKYADAEIQFFWTPRFNLKWSMKDTTPRPERNALPTPEFTNSIEYLATVKGTTSLPKNWLAKSHSDRHGPTDLKGDKLLIISPIRGTAIELKRDRKVVHTLRYYGPFDGGGYRYYASQMGFTLGSGLGVFVNSTKYGTINGGFRDPTFR